MVNQFSSIISYLKGYLYSVSKDKSLIVTDITKTENFEIEEKFFARDLNVLLIDSENSRIFIGDQNGSIFIYGLEVKNNHIETLNQFINRIL